LKIFAIVSVFSAKNLVDNLSIYHEIAVRIMPIIINQGEQHDRGFVEKVQTRG
jgi:hypothetical protein